MKKRNLIVITALSIALSGCSAPAATTASDSTNSAQMESLKTQVESLSKENESLKAQIDNTPSTEAEAATGETETTANADDKGTTLAMNEAGTLGDWSITVTNAQMVDSVSDNQYTAFKPEEGSKYFLVDITITNNGKSAASFLPSYSFGDGISATVKYQDYTFSATNLLGYSKDLHDANLNPLSSKSGSIAFEIPDNVANSTDELILSLESGSQSLNFKVR